MCKLSSVVFVLTTLVAACSVADDEVPAKASATLMPTTTAGTVTGSVSFTEVGGKVTAIFNVAGASPGVHGLHLHDKGDCSTTMDMAGMPVPGGGAGGHWNPDMEGHGDSQTGGPAHAGDVGNMTIGADGTGQLTFSSPEWTIKTAGSGMVVGHAVIFHANPDDFMTQPTGNAGGRQACGVIAAQ